MHHRIIIGITGKATQGWLGACRALLVLTTGSAGVVLTRGPPRVEFCVGPGFYGLVQCVCVENSVCVWVCVRVVHAWQLLSPGGGP